MKQIEYVAQVLEDGHLSLPQELRRMLGLKPNSLVRVVLDVPEADKQKSLAAWEIFRSLGENAAPGRISDASSNHDQYLYGKFE
ncbi:MAG: hypothetical protein AB1894_13500 [Chloroflexota bacterium]